MTGQSNQRPQLLLIEHDLALREQLYDALNAQGYAVLSAVSGGQVAELLKNQQPAVIVIGLPAPKQIAVAKQIRTFNATIPVVLLESEDQVCSPQEREALHITASVGKTTAIDVVMQRLMSVLEPLFKPAGAPPSSGGSGTSTMLVIDDDPQIHKLLKTFFQSYGFSVTVAGSGEEGLRAASSGRMPDIVLLDINMPGMDGLMVLKKLLAQAPQLPVVMVSGAGEQPTTKEALALGARDYVSKPFHLEYLQSVVLKKVRSGLAIERPK